LISLHDPEKVAAPAKGSPRTSSLSGAKPRFALFDLDHTLLPLDSDFAWGEFTTRIGWTDPETFAQRNEKYFEDYRAGTLDIHDYVRFATEAVRLQGAKAGHAAHLRFMREVIHPAIRSQARALLEQHRARGDGIVIVTATNSFVTRPIADAFGVDELIAVDLERDASGWITGEITGTPSAREGKVTRMVQWLGDRGLTWSDVHTTFYSDSMNDLALLEQVDEPVATNPDSRLRELALERGWRVLDLFKAEDK
jgi:HAD superfamily hydrolase (TIGR01490 family)